MLFDYKKPFLFCLLACCILSVTCPRASSADSAKKKYYRAEACYKKLRHSPKKQKYRCFWLDCIEKYQAVYEDNPSGPWAAAGLYMSGKLYRELYRRSYKKSDKKAAIDIYKRIIKNYPKSVYKRRAENALGNISPKGVPKIASKRKMSKPSHVIPPEDDIAKHIKEITYAKIPVKRDTQGSQPNTGTVVGLRFWSNPSYTRVVIDADSELSYTHRLLKEDVSIRKPHRLYVDLNNSRLGKDIKKYIPINDNLLSDARAGQNTSDQVRVVVDIKSFKNYKIFSLKNPFRIVIDVWGHTEKATGRQVKKDIKGGKIAPGALAKQLALGVRRIVIDPGHGGRDYGAPGCLKGVHEKNIVLKLGLRLAKKIREKLHCEVVMTRTRDKYLTLEERTAFANTKNADLFISLHTNAARDRRAYGIETFFLNLATDDDAILVAARENATSTKNISDLQAILSDLMQNAKINESSRLAVHVQKCMCKNLKKRYSRIKNKGVKQAPFYVLLGAQMPAILIETAFISNSRDCKRLVNSKYQDRMCDAIVKGLREYINETNPTAFLKQSHPKGLAGYGG
ncbi:MAG: N-acetylmuramoyl-L-alanine amidase [Deltaproteobacteria bacterium]|nr:N-acetylmuramoyl-L-alanine amidase [Deltaproteobacteria bacterium]MBW1958422.1 N-acetylmuramoyl-L-alanine amidase [Deltaproteobacteria bacterium]MBW2013602.1 N-acetylmuramoyl-L-alanine amidase [Deltaproteobacteria bacterium]MBW2088739.1 N-acetylmuramoyl-L-alanine amidase [Deltaproteobacteria bacterium]